jgi:uncharacterized RDD family membrane protein YckC
MATFVDSCFIMVTFFSISYVLDQQNEISNYIRVIVLILLLFVYEPICTSRLCTIGQKLADIRVRKTSSLEKISIPAAYVRILVKISLGFISLLAIPFTKEKRAIHDFAAGSIVTYQE